MNIKIVSDSSKLAQWILSQDMEVSNLKLQKLLFYAYGCSLAYGFEEEIGVLNFEAWKYGPVEREAYRQYKNYQSSIIPKAVMPTYSRNLNLKLNAVMTVYGRLTAMELVRQSHLESPWVNAFEKGDSKISTAAIKKHFSHKFQPGQVAFPELILDSGILEIDQIPVKKFDSIEALAAELDAEKLL